MSYGKRHVTCSPIVDEREHEPWWFLAMVVWLILSGLGVAARKAYANSKEEVSDE